MEQNDGRASDPFVHIEGIGSLPVWQISAVSTEFAFPFSRRVVIEANGSRHLLDPQGSESAADARQRILQRIENAQTWFTGFADAFEEARQLGYAVGHEAGYVEATKRGRKDLLRRAVKEAYRRLKSLQSRAAARQAATSGSPPEPTASASEEELQERYNEGSRDGYIGLVSDVQLLVLNRIDNEIGEYQSAPDSANDFAVEVLEELRLRLIEEFSRLPQGR